MAAVAVNPNTSWRTIENETGILKSTAYKILQEHKVKYYKLHKHQEMLLSNSDQRLNFCWEKTKIKL